MPQDFPVKCFSFTCSGIISALISYLLFHLMQLEESLDSFWVLPLACHKQLPELFHWAVCCQKMATLHLGSVEYWAWIVLEQCYNGVSCTSSCYLSLMGHMLLTRHFSYWFEGSLVNMGLHWGLKLFAWFMIHFLCPLWEFVMCINLICMCLTCGWTDVYMIKIIWVHCR